MVKGDLGDEGLNAALGQLDRWLKAELSRGDWDVEDVEVKGQAPEFSWGWEKFELMTYKSGQLAKLPREALERADELRGTTRVAVDELRRLRVADAGSEPTAVVATHGDVVLEVPSPGHEADAGQSPPAQAVRNDRAESTKKRVGSIAGHHFGPEELPGSGRLPGPGQGTAGRAEAGRQRPEGRHRGGPGDLPDAREVLHDEHERRRLVAHGPVEGDVGGAARGGDVGRPWCHHRYAAMRNFLSEQGLLAWEDEGYVIGVEGAGGMYLPGKAARWRAGRELMSWMEDVGEGGRDRWGIG